VTWELPIDAMPVAIDRQMLRRVLVNLVRNAVEAVRSARPAADVGTPRGRVVVRAVSSEEAILIYVEDEGPGVLAEARERIFDPYFTTKADGTGLGLAIVKKIVVEHNGAITVSRSERLGGASFILALPLPHSLAITVAQESIASAQLGP